MTSWSIRKSKYAFAGIAALIPFAVLVWLAGCRQVKVNPAPGQKQSAAQAALLRSEDFAGNEACRECHAKEFEAHKGSRHDQTLRTADEAIVAGNLPKAGRVPGESYALESLGGSMQFSTSQPPFDSGPIDLIFGSGKTGITLAGGFTEDGFTEYRMSYDVRSKRWIPTPGQETASDLGLGRVKRGDEALRCLRCHSVVSGDTPKPPELKLAGVTCERCHGGGAAHIAAAKTPGTQDLRMQKLGLLAGKDMNAVCSQCHMAAVDIPLATVDISSTNRFQTYGLEASQCFKQSGGKLSCITCHDPHTNVATGKTPYVQTCLSCHSPGSSAERRGTTAAVKICPVNPKEKCIGCHMPKRHLVPGAHIRHDAADHLIWAYRKPGKSQTQSHDTPLR